jgi:Protein of unknown function (DUF1360)
MLTEYSVEIRYALCVFAVWRTTHLIVAEDGPWDLIYRLRVILGESEPGRAMDCFYCTSVWVAAPFTFALADHWLGGIISWLAVSGAASLLEQATNGQVDRGHQKHRTDGKN